jgi:hypothetical protein
MHGFWKTLSTLTLILLIICPCNAEGWAKYRSDPLNSGQYSGNATLHTQNLKILWTYLAGGRVKSSPTAADIDSDGRIEIIFGSDDKKLHVLDYAGKEKWNYETGGAIRSSPTIADIDADNRTEIVFGSDDMMVYALDPVGNVLWTIATGGPVSGSPAAADIDDEPGLETIIGSTDGGVYVISSRGILLKRLNINAPTQSTPAIADIDSDGKTEILIGADDHRLYALNYAEATGASYLSTGKIRSAPTVIGQTVVVVSEDGSIYSLKYTETWEGGSAGYMSAALTPEWKQKTGGEIVASPASTTEMIVIGSKDKSLYVLDARNGAILRKYSTSAPIIASPALVRVNGNGIGIIFGSSDGTLHILDSSWEHIWGYKCEGPMESSPIVADLDFDGKTEIIVGSADRIYAFSSSNISLPPTTKQTTTTTTSTTTTTTTTSTTTEATTTTTELTTTTTTTAASTTTTTSSTTTRTTKATTTTSPTTTTTSATTTTSLLQRKEQASGNVLGSSLNFGMMLAILVFVGLIGYVLKTQHSGKKTDSKEKKPEGKHH